MSNQGLQEDAAYALFGIILLIAAIFFAMISDNTELALSIIFGLMSSSLIIVSAIERLKRR